MAAAVLILLIFIFLFALKGRVGHPGLPLLRQYAYAHRGLHNSDVPENSLGAFRRAFDSGYGVELDLHLLKDGNIGIMHDSDLKRMTGRSGFLEELTTGQLQDYHLNGTEETIPTFSQVLELCRGRFPLIIELKSFRGNADQVAETACRLLEGYEGPYCLESFDPRCVRWLRTHRPQLVRGQLSEDFIKNDASHISLFLRILATFHLETFWVKPDFIAQKFCDRKIFTNYLVRKLWHVQGVSWTLQNQEEYNRAVKEGYIPIFEGFLPE